jgi:hypothetical protein
MPCLRAPFDIEQQDLPESSRLAAQGEPAASLSPLHDRISKHTHDPAGNT